MWVTKSLMKSSISILTVLIFIPVPYQYCMKAQSNPKIMAAMQDMMANPASATKYMTDPEISPFIMELSQMMMEDPGMAAAAGATVNTESFETADALNKVQGTLPHPQPVRASPHQGSTVRITVRERKGGRRCPGNGGPRRRCRASLVLVGAAVRGARSSRWPSSS